MFSPTEWWSTEWWSTLWGLAMLALVAVALFEIAYRIRRRSSRFLNYASVRGRADDVLRDLQLATSGVSNTVPKRETPDSLTLKWSYIPGWAFVVAVVAFPLGLIALIARKSEYGTVIVVQESDTTSGLRMAGSFNGATVRAINSVIDMRSGDLATVATTPAGEFR